MKIFITGYGIFRNYPRNPSAEAVKLLQQKLQQISNPRFENIEFVIEPELKVTYEAIDALKYPDDCDFIINVGVSCKADTLLTLETQACKSGYTKLDVENCIKDTESCDGELALSCSEFTIVDVDKIVDFMNGAAVKSTDAGRYLCEYVYYKSLKVQPRSLFVHVCEEDKFSVEKTSQGLYDLLVVLADMYQC
jgi:pyroglutamyl-peptidase